MYDEDIRNLDNVIDSYIRDKGLKRDEFPELERMRAAIEMLVQEKGLEELEVYTRPEDTAGGRGFRLLYAGDTERNNVADDKEKEVKRAFEESWKKQWISDTLDPIFRTLDGFPEETVTKLKQLREDGKLYLLMPPKQKTMLLKLRDDDQALKKYWIVQLAVKEANKRSYEEGRSTQLDTADGEKLRQWTSSYLGKAIEYMAARPEPTGRNDTAG